MNARQKDMTGFAVSNSTVLIYLAKIGKLTLLKELFREVLIPEEVFKEVVINGKEQQQPDAFAVEMAIEEGWIRLMDIEPLDELDKFGIDSVEAEAISLARSLGASVLLDQTHARIAAKTLGLKPKGTIFILLAALHKKLLTYEEYAYSLEELVKAGFRMSEEVYLSAIRMGKEIK